MTQLPTLSGRDNDLGPLPWSPHGKIVAVEANVDETTPEDEGSNLLEEDLVVRR
jgi:hypothetical protein